MRFFADAQNDIYARVVTKYYIKMFKYQLIICEPKKIYIKADKDINGPNGISSFLLFTFTANNINEITAPVTKANKVINKTPFTPNISPNTAISFISPPPMALVAIAIAKNKHNPITKAINLSNNIVFSNIINIIPIITPVIFKPSGMILCFMSMMLIVMSKLIVRQYKTDVNEKPYFKATNAYNTPFNNSISGYCMEYGEPQYLHLPLFFI